MSNALEGKQIVLGVCGGIAAYKSVELLRLLVKQGASVKVMTTANATHFVGAATFEALSGQKVCSDLFGSHEDASIQHIRWAESADAVVVARPRQYDRQAGSWDSRRCPQHLFTGRQLPGDDLSFHEYPDVRQPCGAAQHRVASKFWLQSHRSGRRRTGLRYNRAGRLPDPAVLVELLTSLLTPKDFRSQNVVVTAGPTREAIDPVRFLSNPSSGKMGYAIARAAEMRGANVILISGPTSLKPPPMCA